MKKIFAFIMLLALTATTAFVFASSKKFVNQGLVVKDASSNYHQISLDADYTGLELQNSASGTMRITKPGSTTSNDVYFYDGSTYQQVTANGW